MSHPQIRSGCKTKKINQVFTPLIPQESFQVEVLRMTYSVKLRSLLQMWSQIFSSVLKFLHGPSGASDDYFG